MNYYRLISFEHTLNIVVCAGYVVDCELAVSCGTECLRFLVQSELPLERVERSIEEFIVCAHNDLRDMSIEQFERHRSAAVELLRVRPKTLFTQAGRYWGAIVSHLYHFDRGTYYMSDLFYYLIK